MTTGIEPARVISPRHSVSQLDRQHRSSSLQRCWYKRHGYDSLVEVSRSIAQHILHSRSCTQIVHHTDSHGVNGSRLLRTQRHNAMGISLRRRLTEDPTELNTGTIGHLKTLPELNVKRNGHFVEKALTKDPIMASKTFTQSPQTSRRQHVWVQASRRWRSSLHVHVRLHYHT